MEQGVEQKQGAAQGGTRGGARRRRVAQGRKGAAEIGRCGFLFRNAGGVEAGAGQFACTVPPKLDALAFCPETLVALGFLFNPISLRIQAPLLAFPLNLGLRARIPSLKYICPGALV